MKIVEARKEDAPLIARSIMDAVGEEICLGLAGRHHTLEDVEGLFTPSWLSAKTASIVISTPLLPLTTTERLSGCASVMTELNSMNFANRF